jgi:hypothetical protein
MTFCPDCGIDHHAGERDGGGKSAEVRIAEINAKRDIEVARIQRGESRAETEAAIEMTEIETEGAVEVAAELADALAGPADPEPETGADPAEPVVITEDPAPPADDITPPEVESHHEPAAKAGGLWPHG